MKDFREAHPTASSLDDDGCRKLAAAIILQAASDLYDDIKFRMKYPDSNLPDTVCSIINIRNFAYGKWFNCLTNIDPNVFIDSVIMWYSQKRDLPRYISLWRSRGYLPVKNKPGKCYYDSSYLQNIMNNKIFTSNWKCNKGRFIFLGAYEDED